MVWSIREFGWMAESCAFAPELRTKKPRFSSHDKGGILRVVVVVVYKACLR